MVQEFVSDVNCLHVVFLHLIFNFSMTETFLFVFEICVHTYLIWRVNEDSPF